MLSVFICYYIITLCDTSFKLYCFQPTRCNNNNLLISKIISTCFGQSFAHLQERKTGIFTAYGIVSCCCRRPGFGERQRSTIKS